MPVGANRRLAYTAAKNRNEIRLAACPYRLNLSPFIAPSAGSKYFGAIRNCAWPSTATRRFLLYQTLLQEIGHAQHTRSKDNRIGPAGVGPPNEPQ